MFGKKRTEAWDRTLKAADQLKPAAEQLKPLAKSTTRAARRQILRTRAWAAPQLERSGQVLQDSVAPKVSAALSAAAERIDPAKPRRGRWRLPVGIAAVAAAAASAGAAVLRGRTKSAAATQDSGTDATATSASTGATSTGATSTGPTATDQQVRAG